MPKEVAFRHDNKRWDTFERFHTLNNYNSVVHFETGELVIWRRKFAPYERCLINDFGLMFVSGHDSTPLLHKLMTPEGQPVKKGWLKPAQSLMVDTSTGQVIALSYQRARAVGDTLPIPTSLEKHHIHAYCAGPGKPWVSFDRIHYSKPAKLTREEKQELKDKRLMVQAQARVGAIPSEFHKIRELGYQTGWELGENRWFQHTVPYNYVLGVAVDSLKPFCRAVLAFHGYAPLRDHHQINELRVAG